MKWVVFDLGGTLLFDKPSNLQIVGESLEKCGRKYDVKKIENILYTLVVEYNKKNRFKHDCPYSELLDDYYSVFSKILRFSENEANRYRELFVCQRGLKFPIEVPEGIYPIFKRLKEKDCHVGIISNAKPFIKEIVDFYNLSHYSESTILSYALQIEKPDKLIFKKFLTINRINESQLVYVGNDIATDIEPTNQMGIKSVFFDADNSEKILQKLKAYPNNIGHVTDLSDLIGKLE